MSIASLSINLIVRRTVYRQLVDSRHLPLTKATCVSFELYIRENPGDQVQIYFVISLNALLDASCSIISLKICSLYMYRIEACRKEVRY